MNILGIHHISIVSADARRSADFYTRVLGMHLVKKTVDFEAPDHYHLYFGDGTGRPSTLVTCIEKPGAEHGHPGLGGTHHFASIVETSEAQLKWKRRLNDFGIPVTGPYNRVYFTSIYFRDPDGTILEIATREPGFAVDEPVETLGQAYRRPPLEFMDGHRDEAAIARRTWPEPVNEISSEMRLSGLHHITVIGSDIERTTEFYTGILGLQLVKRTSNFDDPTSPHYYYALRFGEPGTIITYFERDPAKQAPVKAGAGQTHHFSFNVADEEAQSAWRERLLTAGLAVSQARDFKYYKSIQFHDPFGHLLEIATHTPGFSIDETRLDLGKKLQLPDWLERDRSKIEATLAPIHAPVEARP
jgi:glyoxalase family protein